ncbi:hypothetical protein [Georgenia thermotolerans]|uniref:Uncharacterized protein n=1 Tax=Georgenia thermotolerans TaxID=527326 RepID=A0A7J5USQ2_9MICO|nr:hypothetical protein [Georgenia thermotolerans]KAE8765300.1 hypothetical protein GB883_04455 [Georgenia thermotolerans]
MTAIALEVDLEMEQAWGLADVAEGMADDVDPAADPDRVWCDFSRGPAIVVAGFCEHCGAVGHDDL